MYDKGSMTKIAAPSLNLILFSTRWVYLVISETLSFEKLILVVMCSQLISRLLIRPLGYLVPKKWATEKSASGLLCSLELIDRKVW